MKRILVPIDFSRQSENAIKLASKIAKKTKSDIYILHVIELPTGAVDMVIRSSLSIPASMMYLKKVREKLLKLKEQHIDKNISAHHDILLENPYEGIKKYANKIDANIIIMGSKGMSDLEEMIIGSNTEKIVRTSKIPVIVVKKDSNDFKIKKIIFASDFKEESKISFKKFLDFANSFKSDIYLLKINTINNFESSATSKEKIKSFTKDFNISTDSIYVYNDISVAKGITNFAEEKNADLICLSTHGRSGLSKLFNGSISNNLSKNALRPVLTFRI